MIIYLGADHGGFELKQKIKQYLEQKGYQVEDLGAFKLDPNDDYPSIAWEVATKVSADHDSRGILFCRTGAGMVVVANKAKGVRAVDVMTVEQSRLAREKNDANVISLAADWVRSDQVLLIIDTFLSTDFEQNSRHQRRVEQIKKIESN